MKTSITKQEVKAILKGSFKKCTVLVSEYKGRITFNVLFSDSLNSYFKGDISQGEGMFISLFGSVGSPELVGTLIFDKFKEYDFYKINCLEPYKTL
jgi:hypothetical protein